MTSRDLITHLAKISYPNPGPAEIENLSADELDALTLGIEEARAALASDLEIADVVPDGDPLIFAIEQARGRKERADAELRLLLAFGREYVRPRPYTLEALAPAAGLSPSGVSRAYGPEEIAVVSELTGLAPRRAIQDVKDFDPEHFAAGRVSRERCTWGGGGTDGPCTDEPRYTVIDVVGSKWSSCTTHISAYLASRPED